MSGRISKNLIQKQVRIIHYCVKRKLKNVQMVLYLQSRLRSIRQHILGLVARIKCQRKPKKNYACMFERKRKGRISQKKPSFLHAVLPFLQETSRCHCLSLLHRCVFLCRKRRAEEVPEHALPSSCRRTTVSLRPTTQVRNRKT